MSEARPSLTRRAHVFADEIREGDPYELSGGHPIRCFPAGGRGSQATGVGYKVLESDPAVKEVGIDTGYAPAADLLRAPDVAVGNVPDAPGWVKGVPLLAVEYADTGQDEAELQKKIGELLAAGTRLIWVVRLTGTRRVEIHEKGRETRIARPGEELTAPGILESPVPVEALYDPQAGDEVAFRNQLRQRGGYESLDDVRAEGEARGRTEAEVEALRDAILAVFASRDVPVGDGIRQAIGACDDAARLRRWLRQAATAPSADVVLAPED